MEKELPHVLPFQRHLTLFLCFVFQSSRRRHPFTYIHVCVCVASHPQHTDSPIPSPALLQLHSLCVISKICHCLLPGQAQKRSRRNRKFNFIFMSCNPATLPFPVPRSPLSFFQRLSLLSFFCGVIQPPNGLCKKFNNRNTLGTRKVERHKRKPTPKRQSGE